MNEYLQSSIPSHWNLVPINELTELIRGVSYKRGDESTQKVEGYIPIYRANNIQNNLIEDDLYYIPHSFVGDKQYLQEGDILLSLSSGSKKAVGKATLIKEIGKGTFGTFCGVLRPKRELVNPLFLSYFFKTSNYRENISDLAGGVNINNISKGHFSKIFIPLPPMNEQLLIIDVVEKLLARVNTVKERLDRVPAIMQQFRQSVLAVACSGRLTEDWRENHISNIEPKAYFDEVITISKQLKNNRRTNNNEKIESKTDEIPDNWMNFYGHQIFPFITSGSRGWAKYYSNDGFAFIRIGNLTRDSINIDLSNIQKVTPPETAERNRIRVKENDILISITADIGSIGLVTKDMPESYINQHIAIARPLPNVNPKYLSYFLLSPNGGKIQFQNLQRGATKIGLGLDDIRSLKIPIPLIEEQLEIVHKIGILFAHAIRIEEQVTAARERVETITQSILHQAFTGKLIQNER